MIKFSPALVNLLCFVFLLVSCERGIFEEDDFAAAKRAYAERNLPLTERLLERFLAERQDSEERWHAWNLLLQAMNANRVHARSSLDCLEAMAVEYEDDPKKMAEILPRIGGYNREIRHLDEAMDAWNAYLDLPELDDGRRIEGYRQLANIQFAKRHYDAAEETLQQCLALPAPDRDKTACILDLAEKKMLRDQWLEAADLAQQILDSEPDQEMFGKACFMRADALEQLGQKDEALVFFEKLKDVYPNPLVIENRIEHLKKKESR